MSRASALAAALAAVTLLGATTARAQVQQGVPEIFPSKNDLSAHLGFQAGFGGRYGSVSGLKIEGDYAYRFHPFIWFNADIANVFGFGSADGLCANSVAGASCYRGGWALELMAGIKLKFTTRIPLVIEAPALVGVEVLYNRDCGDNGAAVPVFKTGGGAKYFLKKNIAVGAKFDVAFGPAFHGAGTDGGQFVCQNTSYTDFFGYFDFLIGAEFIL